jgi:hypothetical protein
VEVLLKKTDVWNDILVFVEQRLNRNILKPGSGLSSVKAATTRPARSICVRARSQKIG